MKLREYLATEPGSFVLAESYIPLAAESLPEDLLDQEAAVYLHGQDAVGRSKIHLYVGSRHVATHVTEPDRGKDTDAILESRQDQAKQIETRESSEVGVPILVG